MDVFHEPSISRVLTAGNDLRGARCWRVNVWDWCVQSFVRYWRFSDDARGRWRGRRSNLSHRGPGWRRRWIRLVRPRGTCLGGRVWRLERGTQPAGRVSKSSIGRSNQTLLTSKAVLLARTKPFNASTEARDGARRCTTARPNFMPKNHPFQPHTARIAVPHAGTTPRDIHDPKRHLWRPQTRYPPTPTFRRFHGRFSRNREFARSDAGESSAILPGPHQ